MNRRPGFDWRVSAALAGLALGLGIALAANVGYGLPRGPVVLGLGLTAPLVLPITLFVAALFDVTGWRQRLLLAFGLASVALPAVAVTSWHTYALVIGADEPAWIAFVAPLPSEGLAGVATLGLARLVAGRKARSGGGDRSGVRGPSPARKSADAPPPSAQSPAAGDLESRAQQLISGSPSIGRDKLAAELGCSKHQARVQLDRYKRLRVAS